jgi:hypothetical protein
MILFYIDESGTGWEDDQTNFFSLGSFAIHISHWQEMDREIKKLKESFFTQRKSEEWEIKTRDLWQGEGKLKRRSRQDRSTFFLDIANVLNNLNCFLSGVIVNKKLLVESGPRIKDTPELYKFAFDCFIERLDDFLKEKHEVGILLMDSRSTFRTAVQDTRLIKAYQQWVRLRKTPSSFIELPWFARSDYHAGLQLADYVAYLISRRWKEIEKVAVDKNEKAVYKEIEKGVVDNAFLKKIEKEAVDNNALLQAFKILQAKINLFEIPEKSIK